MKTGLLAAICFVFIATSKVHAYYDLSTGRWASRDPISEVGFTLMSGQSRDEYDDDSNRKSQNDYVFVGNTPAQSFDYLGLSSVGIYNGSASGGVTLCGVIPCLLANGADFKNFATRYYDYQIDINSCYGGEQLWKVTLISKIIALKKQGAIIDKIGFIDHAVPGIQLIGEEYLQAPILSPISPDGKAWANFYHDLGKEAFSSWWGDIVLEGCSVAEGKVGHNYLQDIANLTEHPVTGCTGSVGVAGFWSGTCFGQRVTETPDSWDLP